MRKICFMLLLVIIVNAVSAQSGKITGKVLDAGSGLVLPSATVTLLIEKPQMQVADQNGNFSFGRLAPGNYSVKCSYAGYHEKTVDSIIVKNDDITSITVSLKQMELGGVKVVATRARAGGETVASLLTFRKNLANSSDFVTGEQLRRTPAKTVSDAIKMVSGASIQDDRFAVIRGLNDRYNAAFINGAPLPSTESDRKAFAFDIFPSAILDNLIIYKTATPDKPGEFAGGIIDITTKSILPKSFTSISFGASYNSSITGKSRYYSENKGGKDWIGVDNGIRGIPSGIPSASELRGASFAQKAEYAKLFKNYKWGVKKRFTGPNYNFQLSKGINIERNQKEFIGALFSLNYNRSFTFPEVNRNGFTPGFVPSQMARYRDSIYDDEVIVAALVNISVKINSFNNISWKNNLSVNSDNQVLMRTGAADYTADPNSFTSQTIRWFTSNQIFSSQLIGEHLLGTKKTKINWVASYSKVKRDIPNLSRMTYSGRLPDVSNLTAVFSTPPSQTSGSGTMFFSRSNENIKSVKADITQPYTFMKNTQNSVKIGGGYQIRKRDFTSRTLGFSPYDGGGVSFDYSLLALPQDQILLPEHIGVMKNGSGGFLLNDGTLANSDYTASSALTHAFIMNDQRFHEKFRLIYGVRMERFNQKLNSLVNLSTTVHLNTTNTDFLPSVNLIYSLTTKMNLRLSYAQTINRPEFRELAPFLFFDNVTGYLFEGTSTLKRAKIRNYDFRYEFYPGKAQLFSVSAFYKEFKDPIELVTLPNTSSQAKYINTSSGKVYGAEVEFRTLLSTLLGIKRENTFLNKITLAANAAYLKSSVTLKDSLFGFAPKELFGNRALQGQSPYIINGSLAYNDEKTGFSSTLSVNRVGDRIFLVGISGVNGTTGTSNGLGTPDIYEKARTVVDFQLAKFFVKNILELKFTVKDILAPKIKFYLDYDKSHSFTDADRYFSENIIAPRIFSLSATYKF